MEMRAAYTDQALYFWCKITDNNWVDYAGWWTDVVDIYVDAMDATGIQDPINWFNPTQWALTFSSKQIQVGMGATTTITGYNYRFYDDLAMSITDHAATFGEATYEGMTMELVGQGTNVKIQEWMVPITQVSPVNGTTQGASIGFTGGYNDVDNDAPDCTNSLRFVGLCDPYCEPPNPAVWGAAEFGPALGGSNTNDCIIHTVNPPGLKDISFISRRPIAKSELYTIRGERLVPSVAHSSSVIYIHRAVLTNGKSSIERVGVRSR
jgi:hypothetical protein